MKSRKSANSLDFFSGGVPAGAILKIQLTDIRELLTEEKKSNSNRALQEIAFIGSCSYFEVFWKETYASLINICPNLIEKIELSGVDVKIDPKLVLDIGNDISYKIGFLIAEKLDFGSAKKINGYFLGTSKVSPFSKDNAKFYDAILSDRNLVVHHGGIYTSSYYAQKIIEKTSERMFLDSLVIDTNYVLERISFFEEISVKSVYAIKKSILKMAETQEIEIDNPGISALKMTTGWEK